MNKYYLIDIEILKKKTLKSSKYIELPEVGKSYTPSISFCLSCLKSQTF